MANTNRFKGLASGPIDHKSTSIINQIANGAIDMGSVVAVTTTIVSSETLPRVEEISTKGSQLIYGIVVEGDADGVYGDGSASSDDSTRAAVGALQGVGVVTQGRCLARVSGDGINPVTIGAALTQSATAGVLEAVELATNDKIIAFALNDVAGGDIDMIAVDVQRKDIGATGT